MSALFDPVTLRSLTIPNRAWVSPMCMYSAPDDGPNIGAPTDFHLAHLVSRAYGGAGLVMAEATAVRAEGRISPHDLGLWNDTQQQALARIAAAIDEAGAVPAIQLAHAGRKASTAAPFHGGQPLTEAEGGWPVVGPSAVPFAQGHPVPHEVSAAEIGEIVEAFAQAARRALAAGFRALEIHGAHGYLIHSFLSPQANRRTDEYGGSFANRARFALEVVDAVRAVLPDELPLFFRVSATDWLTENPADDREGWSGADTVALAKELLAHGVDLLDASSGGMVPDAQVPTKPGYQVPFAAQVRQETGLATGAVGLITEPDQAADIIASGQADAVLLARQLLREPYWPIRAARELGDEPRVPPQYARAFRNR